MAERRLIDESNDPRYRPLAEALRKIDAPAVLSPETVARIRQRAEDRGGQAQRWRWPVLLVPALALLALFLWRWRPLSTMPPSPIVAAQTTPAAPAPAATPTIVDPPAPTVAEAGPPHEPTTHPAHNEPRRHIGRAIEVRGTEVAAALEIPGGQVSVAPHASARVEVHGYAVRVAAYGADARVSWHGVDVVVPRGTERELVPASPTTPAPPSTTAPTGPAAHDGAGSDGVAPEADEAALLADVLQRLRTDHDSHAALRLLDDYDRRFPSGELKSEAIRLRQEAETR